MMNLSELRESIASDATRENAKLKEELKRLQKKYERETKELNEKVEALRDDCRALGNRCFVLTKGAMCIFCRLNSGACEHALSFEETIKAAEKFRREG